ncbi:unnamed protein product [Brachionus calyciflorus]|uniref:Pseudouridine synthase II N-terminal domain-containing protein n=1 Tax=Brachionus calyciflorus TaxID=104777 RepID=A0A813MLB9_9BILA|nr:unnamed protein product [Brachionus calyciflorus]
MGVSTKLVHPDSLFKNLSGFFALYKPPDLNLINVLREMKFAFVKGTNESWNGNQKKIVKVTDNEITLENDITSNFNCSGYRYIRKDFKIDFLHPISEFNSGIIVGSVNTDKGYKIEKKPLIKAYHIKGRLGILTNDNTNRGSLIERATYTHVNRSKMDRMMSSIQSVYQREILKNPTNVLGISEETYEEASKGIIIPKSTKTPPQIYDIKCIEFDRPFFKIEIQTINESESFLINLIHSIGLRLRTYAICVQIRRIKYGPIDLNSNCLLQNEWKEFNKILENLKETNKTFQIKKFV